MGQDGAGPGVENGGHGLLLGRDRGPDQAKHARGDRHPVRRPQSALDGVAVDATIPELVPGDQPVLRAGQTPQQRVELSSVHAAQRRGPM